MSSAQNKVYLQASVVLLVSWKQPLPVGSLIFSTIKKSSDLLFASSFNSIVCYRLLMFKGECPQGRKMPCFLWQQVQLALPWKRLGLEREKGQRDKRQTFLLRPKRFMLPEAGNMSRWETAEVKALPKPSSKWGDRSRWCYSLCQGIT